MKESNTAEHPMENAVKLVGEALLPGASLLMEGEILKGGAHMLAGFAAKALLGPIGLVVVAANSYSQSTTGQGIAKHLVSEGKEIRKRFKRDEPTPAQTQAPATP